MARTVASLPAGSRITNYISLGVVAKFFPREKVDAVVKQTERTSVRKRELPAHVVVYYVVASALYMRSSYREVLRSCWTESNGCWNLRCRSRWPASRAYRKREAGWARNR
jgi:hypothetical protein